MERAGVVCCSTLYMYKCCCEKGRLVGGVQQYIRYQYTLVFAFFVVFVWTTKTDYSALWHGRGSSLRGGFSCAPRLGMLPYGRADQSASGMVSPRVLGSLRFRSSLSRQYNSESGTFKEQRRCEVVFGGATWDAQKRWYSATQENISANTAVSAISVFTLPLHICCLRTQGTTGCLLSWAPGRSSPSSSAPRAGWRRGRPRSMDPRRSGRSTPRLPRSLCLASASTPGARRKRRNKNLD